MTKWLSTALLILLTACTTTIKESDLPDTPLYLFPVRAFFDDNSNFRFTHKERALVEQAAEDDELDVVFEVFLNPDETVRYISLIHKTKYADEPTISNIKSQITRKGFFRSYGKNSAFYYGVNIKD